MADAEKSAETAEDLAAYWDEKHRGIMESLQRSVKRAHLQAYLTGTGVVTRRNGKIVTVAPDPELYEQLIPPLYQETTED